MSTINAIEAEELERLKAAAHKASKAYKCGFGRCLVYRAKTMGLEQSAEALQALLSEDRVECFVDSIRQQTPQLPNRDSVWIIHNAHALNDFGTSAWLKTALDIHPQLKVILVTDTRPAKLTEGRLNLLGALAV